jgi:hypothetical protein
MFGAVFLATLLVYSGVSVLALISVIVTGAFTTLSIHAVRSEAVPRRRVVT